MKLRALIVDDEAAARERLRDLSRAEEDLEIIGEASNGLQALDAIRRTAPDLVFLDIRMPELGGLEVIQSLGTTRPPAFILVTAYDQFALQAFEVCAVDYLLKPFDRRRFRQSVDRAREAILRRHEHHQAEQLFKLLNVLRRRSAPPEQFTVRAGRGIVFVKKTEVDWIRGADNYSELHVGEATHLLRQSLASLEQELRPCRFVRLSRSLLVNLDRVQQARPKAHGDFLVVLRGGTQLAGSRNYRLRLRQMLGS